MPNDFETAFIRIFQTSLDEPAGAGFLLDEKHILTCAHVIADALGLERTTPTFPESDFRLDFPLVAPGQVVVAKVVAWQPMLAETQLAAPSLGEDIAVLELISALPEAAKPCLPLLTLEYWKHNFRAYGFPEGDNNGVHVSGILMEKLANGWVQIDDDKGHGYFVKPGFSGGPIWDETVGGIVGIVVAADRKIENRSARMIPTPILAKAWSPLQELLEREKSKTTTPPAPLPGSQPVPVYISHAPEDETYLDEMLKQFSLLSKRQKLISVRHSGDNPAGDRVQPIALAEARLVMLMLSSDYFTNDTCWEVELTQALKRRENNQAVVVPVIVRPCEWYNFDTFNELKPLLPGKKPVINYDPRDEAYEIIVNTVRGLLATQLVQLRSASDIVPDKPIIETLEHRTPKPIPGSILSIPSLPENYLRRDSALVAIRSILLGQNFPVGITGAKLGVQGMGGVGKTVLAAMLVSEEEVKKRYPDGVFWLAVGQKPELLSLQTRLATALGDNRLITDIETGRQQLAEAFKERECLLVLDDLWEAAPASYLAPLGEKGQLLFTTRKGIVAQELGAQEHELDLLSEEDALKFLFRAVRTQERALPPEAKEVARECGYLPLALAIAGALVTKLGWQETLQKLQTVGIIGAGSELEEYAGLYRSMEASLIDLDPQNQERYLQLAVFKDEAAIPLESLAVLWGLERRETDELAALLGHNALLRWTENYNAVTLHDLQRDYLLYRIKARLPQLQRAFVEAYRTRGSGEYWGVKANKYYYQNLPYHLIEAGQRAEFRELLLNYRWLEAKLRETDVAQLLKDYDLLAEYPELQAIKEALTLGAHLLAREPASLWSQLAGRLLQTKNEAVVQLRLHPPKGIYIQPFYSSLEQAGGVLKRSFEGHGRLVNGVAVLPDGKGFISASADKTLKLWNIEQEKAVRTFEGHIDAVIEIAVLPDGQHFVSASGDNTLKLWNIEQEKAVRTFKGHFDVVHGIAMLPDGQHFVSASADNTLKLWNIEQEKAVRTFKGHSNGVTGVAMLPNGQRFISASADNTLKLWNIDQEKAVRTFKGHSNTVFGVAVLPDGKGFISTSFDNTLKLWNIETGKEVRSFEGHRGMVRRVAVLSDGQHFVSASADKTLKLWNIDQEKAVRTFEGHNSRVMGVAVLSDGQHFISASADNTLKLWNIETGEEVCSSEGHRGMVRGVAMLPDGQHFISASADNTLKLWNIDQEKAVRTFEGHIDAVNGVAVLPDGKGFISASADNTLKLWNIDQEKVVQTFEGHNGGVRGVIGV